MRKLVAMAAVLAVVAMTGCLVSTTRSRRETVVVREHDHGRHGGHGNGHAYGHDRGRGNPHHD